VSRTKLITDPQTRSLAFGQIAIYIIPASAGNMPSDLASSLAWAVLSAVANGSFGVFAKIKPVAEAQVSSTDSSLWLIVSLPLSDSALSRRHAICRSPRRSSICSSQVGCISLSRVLKVLDTCYGTDTLLRCDNDGGMVTDAERESLCVT